MLAKHWGALRQGEGGKAVQGALGQSEAGSMGRVWGEGDEGERDPAEGGQRGIPPATPMRKGWRCWRNTGEPCERWGKGAGVGEH